MSGIATAIIVESRPSIKKAQPMTSGIRILRRGSLVVPFDFMTVSRGAAVDTKRTSDHSRSRISGGAIMVSTREIGTELLECWALGYLGRYASSAENLRRVLMRRVRRHAPEAAEPA